MANIINYKRNNFDLFLTNVNYWDLHLSNDAISIIPSDTIISGDCLTINFDFNNNLIYSTGTTSANTIYSIDVWTGATNTGYTLNTIGLTGIDNGLISFTKVSGDTSNLALLSTLTGSTLIIPSGDTRFFMNRVTGMTGNYVYPMEIIEDSTSIGDYNKLCGGFYQGFFKLDGYTYDVLPTRVPKGWTADFWLFKSDNIDCSGVTGTTLNIDYPNNKGFFFYIGTRAENKYWNIFDGLDTGCTSGCTIDTGCTGTVSTFCTLPREQDINILDDSGYLINLNPPPLEIQHITNQFLIYGRAGNNVCGSCSSTNTEATPYGYGHYTTSTYSGGGITITSHTQTVTNNTNPFLIYGRAGNSTCCNCGASGSTDDNFGHNTISSFSGFTSDMLRLDVAADVIDNAIGFRIKDDGSIGYRALRVTGYCSGETYVTGVTVEEQYSTSGMVTDDQWQYVSIRFVMSETYDNCQLQTKSSRKGKLMFYVNAKLKFVANEIDELIFKRLTEHKNKQLGVPYNMSLGGGSQGLLESMTFDGQDPNDLGLHIENNFAGTFIGYISQFRFYICDLNWSDITNNYNQEKLRYGY